MDEEAITALFNKMESVQHVCSLMDQWNDEPGRFLEKLGDMMEDFYQCWVNVSENRGVSEQLRHIITSELSTLSNIYRYMTEKTGVTEVQIDRFHGPVYTILQALVGAMNGEELTISDDWEERGQCQTDNFRQFHFPADMFSTKELQFHPTHDLDRNMIATSYLDGIVALSNEGALNFLNDVYGLFHWRKNSFAYMAELSDFKGLTVPTFRKKLPLFYIDKLANYTLWGTILPSADFELTEHISLATCKQWYDLIFDEVVFEAMSDMPTNSNTRVNNTLTTQQKPLSYTLVGQELEEFSFCLQRSLHSHKVANTIPKHIDFHFLVKDFGQDVILNEHTIRTYQSGINVEECVEAMVHIATNFSKDNLSMFWSRNFIDVIFHDGGRYFSSGFNKLAAGAGQLPKRLETLVGEEVKYLTCYNTMFKKMRRQLSAFHPRHRNFAIFDQPVMSKLLSCQPYGIQKLCKGKVLMTEIVHDLSQQTWFNILDDKLELLSVSDQLHCARIEFVCSFRHTELTQLAASFTGMNLLDKLTDITHAIALDHSPVVPLPRQDLSVFMTNMLNTLESPIRRILDKFFHLKRPVSPDELETVHVCESLISFILYGGKQYMTCFKNIGLTGQRFRDQNRITLAFAEMRKKDSTEFLVNAAANRIGTVYSISYPILPASVEADDFTESLFAAHREVVLNETCVSAIVIGYMFQIFQRLCSENAALGAYFGRRNPSTIFTQAFVSSLPPVNLTTQVATVPQFVDDLMRLDINTSMGSAIETSIETLADLTSDQNLENDDTTSGAAMLRNGLSQVLNAILKGHINVQLDLVPMIHANQITTQYQHIIPSLKDVLLKERPITFHGKLAQSIFHKTAVIMGPFNPFRYQNVCAGDFFLLYTLVKNGPDNVPLAALRLLGSAMVLKRTDNTPTFRNFMSHRGYGVKHLNALGLLQPMPEDFRFQTSLNRTHEEKVLYRLFTDLHQRRLIPY